jgi:hypothetical protein
MKRYLAVLTISSFLLSVALTLQPESAHADQFDAIIAARDSPLQGLPACSGVSDGLVRNGLRLVKSEVCTDFAQIMSGAQSGQNIGSDLQSLLVDLQADFGLPAFCAASLMLVFAQQVVNAKISLGSCPVH